MPEIHGDLLSLVYVKKITHSRIIVHVTRFNFLSCEENSVKYKLLALGRKSYKILKLFKRRMRMGLN